MRAARPQGGQVGQCLGRRVCASLRDPSRAGPSRAGAERGGVSVSLVLVRFVSTIPLGVVENRCLALRGADQAAARRSLLR